MNRPVLAWLLFPGAVFVFTGAIAAGWIERKLRARMEYRSGPPPLQILYDWIKLAVKHSGGFRSARGRLRLFAASAGLAGALGFSMLVWQARFFPSRGFAGDFFAWMAGFAAASLLPDLADSMDRGRSRNARGTFDLRLTAEFPLFIAWGVPFLGAGGSFRISDVITAQRVYGPGIFSPEGVLAFAVSFVSLFTAIRASEADGPREGIRVDGGSSENHPGFRLALPDMSRLILLFTAPEVMVLLFAGGTAPSASGRMVSDFLYAIFFLLHGRRPQPRSAADARPVPPTASWPFDPDGPCRRRPDPDPAVTDGHPPADRHPFPVDLSGRRRRLQRVPPGDSGLPRAPIRS
jgi:NADH-quinone oxidoreductase subunit H